MSVIRSATPATTRPHRRKKPADVVASLVLRKPTDEIALLDLGAQLNGRPVPGLRMTEAEFERWADADVHAEWVDGEVILMPPVNLEQSDLFMWMARLLSEFVEHHDLGKVLGPEFTVRLPRQRRRRVPDLLFLSTSRLNLLRPTYLDGPPDLSIEIVSPDSVVRDWRDKYQEYQAAGVREYWVVDPTSRRAEAYVLEGRKYVLLPEEGGRIASRVLKGFYLKPEWLWKSPLPRVATVLRELGIGRR